MTKTYSICHNDDDPADPGHRRVRLELKPSYVSGVMRWYADGVPLEWSTCSEFAEKDLERMYSDPVWDLREEGETWPIGTLRIPLCAYWPNGFLNGSRKSPRKNSRRAATAMSVGRYVASYIGSG